MITNALLQQIQTPGPSTTAGQPGAYASVVASARCFLGSPKKSQQSGLAELTSDATATAYFMKSLLGQLTFKPRQLLTIALDGSTAATTYSVIYVNDQQLRGPLAHLEVYLKVLV